jgi:O-antigen ligase
MLVAMLPFLDVRALLASLKRPICAVPIAFFVLAVAGTLWSDAPWGVRLYAVGPTLKLLMLPVLLFHFERSERGLFVFTALGRHWDRGAVRDVAVAPPAVFAG